MVLQEIQKCRTKTGKEEKRSGGTIAEYTVLKILQNDTIFLGLISEGLSICRTSKQIVLCNEQKNSSLDKIIDQSPENTFDDT